MRALTGVVLLALALGGDLSGAEAGKAEAAEMDKLIKAKLAAGADLDDVRLDVHWGRRSATVYGSGIGIWNRQSQFRLENPEIVALLTTLDEGGFTKLKSRYGGLPRPAGGPALGAPEMLVGSLSLTIGGVSRGSNQLGHGEKSEELAALAGVVLDICEEAAKDGVSAENLEDGLKKIASGKLDPLSMSLLVQRIENEGRGPNGWILRVRGRQAEVQVRSRTGIAKPVRLELTGDQLAGICDVLVENDAANLPVNLWAPDYTDVSVNIFRARKSVQARKFARMKPTTHGEKQKEFNRIFDALDGLHRRVVKEGKRGE